jgi:hypothetical protein
VNVCPAIVNVPVRLLPVLFAAAVKWTEPLPLPVDPLVMVIQLALLDAVHVHPDCVVTETVPFPPSLSTLSLFREIE